MGSRALARVTLCAAIAATGALIAAGALGAATAEAPTAPSPRTVAVQGVAILPVDQSASAAAATAVYRQAMGAAVADALAKAQFLAGKVGAALQGAQSVVEDGGSISCVGENEYLGEQPDFGSPSNAAGSAAPAVRSRKVFALGRPLRHRARHRKPTARKATVPTCTLSAAVSVSYLLG